MQLLSFILQKSRVALVGPNGRGKSTLVKLALGELHEESGSILRHPQARIGVFAQNIVEQLIVDKADCSALEYMTTLYPEGKHQKIPARFLTAFKLALNARKTVRSSCEVESGALVQLKSKSFGSTWAPLA